ncbi:MAG TPA: DUF4266 domain-containing protein, partial [Polyangiaceae bacterium]
MKHLESRVVLQALGLLLGGLTLIASAGCATVRPEQRAILADPTMQFDAKSADQAALEHALDNREGSTGGGSVRGGGCGC